MYCNVDYKFVIIFLCHNCIIIAVFKMFTVKNTKIYFDHNLIDINVKNINQKENKNQKYLSTSSDQAMVAIFTKS